HRRTISGSTDSFEVWDRYGPLWQSHVRSAQLTARAANPASRNATTFRLNGADLGSRQRRHDLLAIESLELHAPRLSVRVALDNTTGEPVPLHGHPHAAHQEDVRRLGIRSGQGRSLP